MCTTVLIAGIHFRLFCLHPTSRLCQGIQIKRTHLSTLDHEDEVLQDMTVSHTMTDGAPIETFTHIFLKNLYNL